MTNNTTPKSLLDDIDRSRAFFEAVPENFLIKLTDSLITTHSYSRSATAVLADYNDFIQRPSATFSDTNLQLLFEKFDSSFAELVTFLSKNLFVEGNIFTLHPELKHKNEKEYSRLAHRLEELSVNTQKDYESLACELASTRTSEEKKTRVNLSGGTLVFGRIKYKPGSPINQKLYRELWPFRTTASDAKKADSIPLPNLAQRVGVVTSIKDYPDKEEDFISRIKSANGYMRKIEMPVNIRVKGGQAKLIVK